MIYRLYATLLTFLFTSLTYANTLSVTGTWSLESFRAGQPDGSQIDWCLSPTGLLIYTDTGFMSVAINCDKNTPPGGPSQEAGNRLFYSGRYTVDSEKGTVIHHVTNSSLEKFLGKNLVRSAQVNGDQLTLFTIGEKSNTLIWKRLAR